LNKLKGPKILSKGEVSFAVPFVLVTSCFALWGFANDITNPMVAAFSKIFRMSVTDGTLVQVAFYGGYFAMALPAALFIRRYSFKAGVLMGLGLYAIGCFLFFPARMTGNYYPFLIAYFILTCGLSFLETSCNPYILSMGEEATATRRLNLAQAFNPMGSLCGMFVAMNFIQARINPMPAAERATLSDVEFEAVKQSDLGILIGPYLFIGIVILFIFLLVWLCKVPRVGEMTMGEQSVKSTFCRLVRLPRYREGVIAQFFYVGVQIMCWTFIIQYGTRIFVAEGMTEAAAAVLSQKYNIVAMVCFCASRFICTFLLKYVRPGTLLTVLASVAIILCVMVVMFRDVRGLYCLVAVSICMSLMFPTIYGIALTGLGEDAKLGSAGLIMSIVGGSVLPLFQARIIDMEEIFGWPAVNVSFVVPIICFIVIVAYGLRSRNV
jgi:FHS family L-fucose permease-like MFS transporter